MYPIVAINFSLYCHKGHSVTVLSHLVPPSVVIWYHHKTSSIQSSSYKINSIKSGFIEELFHIVRLIFVYFFFFFSYIHVFLIYIVAISSTIMLKLHSLIFIGDVAVSFLPLTFSWRCCETCCDSFLFSISFFLEVM